MDASHHQQHLDIEAFLTPINEAIGVRNWKDATLEATPTGTGLSVRIPFSQPRDRRAILVITPVATGRSDHPIKLKLMVVASIQHFPVELVETVKELYREHTSDPSSRGGCFLTIEEKPNEGDIMHVWWQCECTPSDVQPLNTSLLLRLFAYAEMGHEVLFATWRTAQKMVNHTNIAIQELLSQLPRTSLN